MRLRPLCCLAVVAAWVVSPPLGAQARWSLVENLRIGSEEDGPYLFTQIRGVAVGERGSILVLEYRTQEIRLFDTQGKFIKRVARKGSGPGEIANANGLLAGADGRVWVNDPSNSRYAVFTPSGDYATQHLYSQWGLGYLWQGVFDRTGSLLEYVSVSEGNQRRAGVRRVSADGAKVDTMALPECTNRVPKEAQGGYIARVGGSSSMFGVPFVPNQVRAWDAGGFIWCSSNDAYEILKIRLVRGDTILRVISPRPVLPVTNEEREAAIASIRNAFTRMGQPVPDFSGVPRVKPALQAIDVDDSGRLWVRATTNDTTRTVFDVWDGSTGKQLATVTAPWRIGSAWHPLIRGDTMYAVVLNENEVPVVVRALMRK